MENKRKMSRDKTMDVLKGIAILSVVLGHAWNLNNFSNPLMQHAHHFVYTYHIMLFVFVSGYLFHDMSVRMYLKKRIKSLYLPMLGAVLLSLFLYPLWRGLNVVKLLNWQFFFKCIVKTLLFIPKGIFIAPFWYIPFLFGVGIIALLMVKISKILPQKQNDIYIYILILSLMSSVVGIVFIKYWHCNNFVVNMIVGEYSLLRILVAVPIFFCGWFIKEKKLLSKINYWLWIPCTVVIIVINYITEESIDIAGHIIYGGYQFYLMTAIGLLFSVSLGRFITLNEKMGNVFAVLGQHSFVIMAGHLMAFKLTDGIVGFLYNVDTETLKLFPYSFPRLWLVYTLLGIVSPICVSKLWQWIKRKISLYDNKKGKNWK